MEESGKVVRPSFSTSFLFPSLLPWFPSFWRQGTKKTSKCQTVWFWLERKQGGIWKGQGLIGPSSWPYPQQYKAELKNNRKKETLPRAITFTQRGIWKPPLTIPQASKTLSPKSGVEGVGVHQWEWQVGATDKGLGEGPWRCAAFQCFFCTVGFASGQLRDWQPDSRVSALRHRLHLAQSQVKSPLSEQGWRVRKLSITLWSEDLLPLFEVASVRVRALTPAGGGVRRDKCLQGQVYVVSMGSDPLSPGSSADI